MPNMDRPVSEAICAPKVISCIESTLSQEVTANILEKEKDHTTSHEKNTYQERTTINKDPSGISLSVSSFAC